MRAQLERIVHMADLAANVYEIASKSLGDEALPSSRAVTVLDTPGTFFSKTAIAPATGSAEQEELVSNTPSINHG